MKPAPDPPTDAPARREISRRGQIWIGIIFFAAGLLPMALASGLLPGRSGRMDAPLWVVFVAGCSFSLVGTIFLVPERAVRLRGFVAGLFVTAFATIFLWAGFGPGERHFRGGVSLGPFFTYGRGDDTVGRVVFGLVGLLIAGFAAWAWIRWLRSCFGRSVDGSDGVNGRKAQS